MIKYMEKISIKFGYKLGGAMTITSFNIFLLDINFDKFTIALNFLLIFSIFAKFLEDPKSIDMPSINC